MPPTFQFDATVIQKNTVIESPFTAQAGERSLVTLKPDPQSESNQALWGCLADGAVQLGRLSPAAAAMFASGKSFRVTITPVE